MPDAAAAALEAALADEPPFAGQVGFVFTFTFCSLHRPVAKVMVARIKISKPGLQVQFNSLPCLSASEQVAKTQQETELMTAVLPQIHAISSGPQLPRLFPKQSC